MNEVVYKDICGDNGVYRNPTGTIYITSSKEGHWGKGQVGFAIDSGEFHLAYGDLQTEAVGHIGLPTVEDREEGNGDSNKAWDLRRMGWQP